MKAWILKDKDTGKYMQGQYYNDLTFTSDINEARIFRRSCDAGNSKSYWSSPYGWRSRKKYSFEKIEVSLDISINITK